VSTREYFRTGAGESSTQSPQICPCYFVRMFVQQRTTKRAQGLQTPPIRKIETFSLRAKREIMLFYSCRRRWGNTRGKIDAKANAEYNASPTKSTQFSALKSRGLTLPPASYSQCLVD